MYAIWCRDVICCTSILWLVVLIHVIKLNIIIKIVKSSKFSIKNGPIYKMLKYREEWAFVSPHCGLGGPPSFVACWWTSINILYMGPFFTENFDDFTIFIFTLNLITCIRTTSQSTDVQHITSQYQIVYVQWIRCIKNSP
jgi:hypothetical protein